MLLDTCRTTLRRYHRASMLCVAGLTLALFTGSLVGCGQKEDTSSSAASSGDGYGTPAGGSTTSGTTATDTSAPAGDAPVTGPRGGGQTPGGG